MSRPIQTVSQVAGVNALNAFIEPSTVPATLLSAIITNTAAFGQWYQLWDANSPTDPQAALLSMAYVGASEIESIDAPIHFLRGIYLTNASEPVSATPTAAQGALDTWFITRHLPNDCPCPP